MSFPSPKYNDEHFLDGTENQFSDMCVVDCKRFLHGKTLGGCVPLGSIDFEQDDGIMFV
jgi:hypothetical protein